MNSIILAGLLNSKTSLGEVFRRNIECFQTFCQPDIFDLGQYIKNKDSQLKEYDQYSGNVIDHNIKYFHTTFNLYRNLKTQTSQIPPKFGTRKIGYFVWESSELTPESASVLSDFDSIWTASNYCKEIFSKYVNSERINVVPHPVHIFSKLPKKYKNFTILIMGNISSDMNRKGLVDTLKAASIVKGLNKKVNIIFKTVSLSDHDRREINKLIQGHKVKVIDEYYSSTQTQELMAKCHVLLSLHKSEGFGLTLAESLAVKTPVVCTGYSGNTDFVKNKSFLVDYTLRPTHHNHFKGEWAKPNIDSAVYKLQTIISDYPEIEIEEGYNFIKDNLNIPVISDKMKTLLETI